MITLEKFTSDCQKGKCNRNTIKSRQCEKQYKQELCYNKFVQKQEKDLLKREDKKKERQEEIDEYKRKKESGEKIEYEDNDPQWTEVLKQVWIRDRAQCRFFLIMTEEEKKLIKPHLWGDFKKIDGAHCISRSQSPKMKYDVDNVYLLFRRVHKALDGCFDPFTGKPITKEEVINYWKRIIGEEKYNELIERSKGK
jgi:hypothetical protein